MPKCFSMALQLRRHGHEPLGKERAYCQLDDFLLSQEHHCMLYGGHLGAETVECTVADLKHLEGKSRVLADQLVYFLCFHLPAAEHLNKPVGNGGHGGKLLAVPVYGKQKPVLSWS